MIPPTEMKKDILGLNGLGMSMSCQLGSRRRQFNDKVFSNLNQSLNMVRSVLRDS